MRGSKSATAILTVLAVSGFGGFLLQRSSARALQADADELSRRSWALALQDKALRAGNEDLADALRATRDQRDHLQDQLEKIRKPAAPALPSSSSTEKAVPSQAEALQKIIDRAADDPRTVAFSPGELYPGLIAQKDWVFSGRATPAAAFQTEMWALREKNYAVYAKGLVFGGQTRELSNASFAKLPERVRSQYGTMENLSATLMYNPALRSLWEGIQVAGQSPSSQSPGTVTLDLIDQQSNGIVRHFSRTYTQDVDGDWKQLYPGNMIEYWALHQAQYGKAMTEFGGQPYLIDDDPAAPADSASQAEKAPAPPAAR